MNNSVYRRRLEHLCPFVRTRSLELAFGKVRCPALQGDCSRRVVDLVVVQDAKRCRVVRVVLVAQLEVVSVQAVCGLDASVVVVFVCKSWLVGCVDAAAKAFFVHPCVRVDGAGPDLIVPAKIGLVPAVDFKIGENLIVARACTLL